MPVGLEARGRVALITLDRPERLNTLAPDMLEGLVARLAEVERDEAVGAAVVTGATRWAAAASWSWRATSASRPSGPRSGCPRSPSASSPAGAAPSGCPA